MSEPELPVLAISPTSHAMHVGRAATVLPHVVAERPAAQAAIAPVEWEYYDAEGRPLNAHEGALVAADAAAATTPDDASRQLLVARIGLVLAHAQIRLDALNALGGGAAPGDPTRMVRAEGDLVDVLRMLAALDPDIDPTPSDAHQQGFFHNLWHP